MIYDSLDHIDVYQGIHPGVMQGLQFLRDTDLASLEPGRHNLQGEQGEKMYALIQSYDSKVENERPEAHRKYIDIQYLFEGEELIGVAPIESMTEEVDANPEKDAWHYHGATSKVLLGNGRFAVLWPGDAHAPSISPDGKPAPCRKCVVKVLADW